MTFRRCTLITPVMPVTPMGCIPCEMYAYEIAPVRDTPLRWPMGAARQWEMHVRGTPIGWPMGEARI
jgi:hypothetical protein